MGPEAEPSPTVLQEAWNRKRTHLYKFKHPGLGTSSPSESSPPSGAKDRGSDGITPLWEPIFLLPHSPTVGGTQ